MKDKNLMTIPIDVIKAFEEVQHIVMVKTLSKVGIQVAFITSFTYKKVHI